MWIIPCISSFLIIWFSKIEHRIFSNENKYCMQCKFNTDWLATYNTKTSHGKHLLPMPKKSSKPQIYGVLTKKWAAFMSHTKTALKQHSLNTVWYFSIQLADYI